MLLTICIMPCYIDSKLWIFQSLKWWIY
jgi:hypothetical protein